MPEAIRPPISCCW